MGLHYLVGHVLLGGPAPLVAAQTVQHRLAGTRVRLYATTCNPWVAALLRVRPELVADNLGARLRT